MDGRKILIIFIAIVFLSVPCFAQNYIPSSPRSREAINRLKPRLEKELADQGLRFGAPIFIRIFKKEAVLEVWLRGYPNFRLFKDYPICTYGSDGLGPKTREGDGKAPEGFYYVTASHLNPASNFHLSFNLGYPNSYDRYHRRTGSALMVHGSCVSIGCYAMTDPGIEEIFALADAAFRRGQSSFRVHIFPFKMSAEAIERYKNSEHFDFWSNLKDGYDLFENNGNNPPNAEVRNGRYHFKNQ